VFEWIQGLKKCNAKARYLVKYFLSSSKYHTFDCKDAKEMVGTLALINEGTSNV